MAATETPTATAPIAPAEAEAPKPIADLPDVFEDKSKIIDKAKAEELFSGFLTLAESWYGGYKATRTATADVCKLAYDLRAVCERPDGKPDWAGQYDAYATLYETRVTYVLRHVLKMTKDEATAFRAAVRRYDSDNEYRKLYIARKLAESDPKLGVNPDEITAGFVPPPKLVSALVHEAEGQTVTKSDGTKAMAAGFDKPQLFAQADQAIGVKKSQRTAKAEPAKVTVKGSWEAIQAAVVKRTDDDKSPAVSFTEQAEALHATVSALAVGIVGKPGEKMPSGLTEKAKLIASLTDTRDLLTGILAILDGKVTAEEKVTHLAKLAS